MLRINQNSHAAGAKSYYTTADYYTEGQELTGRWRGRGAALLGLTGEVRRKDWDALCDNRHPQTGATLNARQRRERRVGYDLNFHVPKSVSLLYATTQDERILEAFRDSVDATMRDIESEMKTRVRKGGKDEDRITGNMVWGEFIHTTARPVEGIPDPHLHAHCFVFNTTCDDHEQRWKAGQFADLKRDAPYFEALFHSRLARNMQSLGLEVERGRRGWELQGVPKEVLRKFSRRTALIEAKARERGITDGESKDQLGAKTRERKQKELGYGQLRELWHERLSEREREAMNGIRDRIGGPAIPESPRQAQEATRLAIDHCFERDSVVTERRLVTEALKRSVGAASPESVNEAIQGEDLLHARRDGRRMVTTPEVLAEERAMIEFAREGRGTCRPLGDGTHVFARDWLNEGQRHAVQHVLDVPDRVIAIRGAAGTGKTTMMQEAVEAIEAHGKRVLTFAPSADASRGVLRGDGFKDADTVARLMVDPELQEAASGQVLWVDEAGLLSTRQMAGLFDLADRVDARVILSGDRRQHGSVERGAALRLLEEEAGVIPAEVRQIQRQKGAYRQVVQALSEGHIEAGFKQLERLGWIREVPDVDRYERLANDYVASLAEGKSALVVCPTHLEGEWVTSAIRSQLKQTGRLGAADHPLVTLVPANLTVAERADPVNYAPGDVLVFHQNARGFKKGARVVVENAGVAGDNAHARGNGTDLPFGESAGLVVGDRPVPIDQAARFQVFRPNVVPIARGDLIRVTRNGKTADGLHGLDNGSVFTVKAVDKNGDIKLTNGWTIAGDYGHLTHGYATTSQAAQGKTVDRVLVAVSDASFPASSREGFYVACSRGRERVTVYTGDKASLLEAVRQSDDRLSATELTYAVDRARHLHRLAELALHVPDHAPLPQREPERLDYER